MVVVIFDRAQGKKLIRDRRRQGIDRHDEVWDGVYVMSPIANNEHQFVTGKLTTALDGALAEVVGALVFPGCNVSDQPDNWEKNYRVPDVAVFLPGNQAQDKGTHWLGGPDFAVEILSRHDRSRKKFGFYASVGVRELLLVNRKPWTLELYRLTDGELRLVGKITQDSQNSLASEVLPVSFRLIAGDKARPSIEVVHTQNARRWLA